MKSMGESGVMKCPSCNMELEKGSIFAERGIYWEYKGGMEEALISKLSWPVPHVLAWRCDKCGIVVVNYSMAAKDDKASYDARRLQDSGIGP